MTADHHPAMLVLMLGVKKKKKDGQRADGGRAARRLDRPMRRRRGGAMPDAEGDGRVGAVLRPASEKSTSGRADPETDAPDHDFQDERKPDPNYRPVRRHRGQFEGAAFADGGKTPDFHPGGEKGKLHRELDIPEDEKIPAYRLAEAVHSRDPEIRRDAIRARTMKKWHSGD